ncbi:MAG: TMEM43 family protein [Proteobacteria bacterium]|nr:TMEM43 family protein [Pseudomonadota bacterium]
MSKLFSKEFCDSWYCRIIVIIIFIPISLIVFHISNTLLSCNEENAIYRTEVLKQAEDIIFTENSQLVHIISDIFTNDILMDKTFNISIPHAIKLKRIVKMYQWEETITRYKDEDGDYIYINYDYEEVWKENRIDSGGFHEKGHRNPHMPLQGTNLVAKDITLGGLALSHSLINKINHYKHLKITGDIQTPLTEIYNRKVHVNKDNYYLGNNPNNPQIGDLHVKFEFIYSKEIISVIAKQVDSSLSVYQMKRVDLNLPDSWLDKTFETKSNYIELLQYGVVEYKTMFLNTKIEDFTTRLPARITLFFLIFIGIYLVSIILGRLEILLPFVNCLVRLSQNWISLAFMAIAISLVSIAYFWFTYMPILSIILIVIAIIFISFLRFIHQFMEVPNLLLESTLNPEIVIPPKNS